ncbi:hypothetical protein [Vibrio penaeicida]|uniref:hypothetical protein n=1 Tax=Vibrio penaeicida TaxID=104609 RepID=UPI001CC647EA|nr:hypothetical protein [Vibrio penaeicida]
MFKAFFDAYPAHRKGGSDAHVWKVWKAERLTESDAKLALEWLQITLVKVGIGSANLDARLWSVLLGLSGERLVDPLPITQKRYLPPDFHSGDTSWADDLGW